MLTSLQRRSVICVVLLAPLLASCTSYEVEDHSLQFNKAVGSLGNRLLLLNAVRAAKGYPMQFSKLHSYAGQGRGDGSIGLTIPFINGAGGEARPSINLRTGVQALQLVDLNTAEAQKQLRTQVTAKQFEYYLLQGWNTRLVATITIESLEVPEKLVRALAGKYEDRCRLKRSNPECAWLRSEMIKSCDLQGALKARRFKRRQVEYIHFDNDVRSPCSFYMFQWSMHAIGAGKGTFDLATENKKQEDEGEKKTRIHSSNDITIDVNVSVPKKRKPDSVPGGSIPLFFQDEDIQSIYR